MTMRDATRLDSAGQAFESPAGKAMFKIVMVVFGILVSVLLSLILAGVNHTNAVAEAARDRNYQQDQEIALLQNGYEAQKNVSAASVAAIQSNTIQLTKLQDSIDHIRDIQQQSLTRNRPKQ